MGGLKISSGELIQRARERITEIGTDDAMLMVDSASVVMIDIREAAERQKTGAIPGSITVPRAFVEMVVDPESPLHQPVFAEDKTFVFYCASGMRSALAVASLAEMGFEAAHLKHGFGHYAKCGGRIEPA